MSENAALAAAATYGNLFRSMGMTEELSATMSINLVKLAGDLASFNNLDPTEVFEKLRAGLTGEAEPLKSLGVNINETVIKLKAMELGLSDGKSVLDANSKATAAYALIMEQTSLAQGDFARTSDGLANQQRILTAQMEDLSAAAGETLTPAVIILVTLLNDLTDSEKKASSSAADFINKIAEGTWAESSYSRELRAKNEALAESERLFQEGIVVATKNAEALRAARDAANGVAVANRDLATGMDLGTISGANMMSMTASLTTIENEYATNVETNHAELLTLMEERARLKKQGYSEESQQIRDIDSKLDANAAKAGENAAAHELATNRIILSYAQQILAADGLTQEEAAFLLQKGVDMGIYEETAVEAMKTVITEAGNLTTAIENIPDKKTINIDWSVAPAPNSFEFGYQDDTTDNPHPTATGGSGIVPPGYTHDNYMMGLSSGERWSVTPSSRVGASDKGSGGGGGNSYTFIANGITNPDEFLRWAGNKVKQQGGLPQA